MENDKLEELVLQAIKTQIQLVIDVDKAIKEISKQKNSNIEKEMLSSNISKLENNLQKLKKLKRICYDDWRLEVITEEEYKDYSNDYDREIKQITGQLDLMIAKLNELNISTDPNNHWIDEFKKNKSIKKLNRKILISLVKNIYIKEGGNIKIEFKYNDEFEKVIEYLKSHESMV